jgi:hypothetical protein
MPDHRYRVGQIVALRSPSDTGVDSAPGDSRAYKIIQLLPAAWGGTRYRIKSVVEEGDRIVKEDSLRDDSCTDRDDWDRMFARATSARHPHAAPVAGGCVTEIHVRRDRQDRWDVTAGLDRPILGTYRLRAYAEAYARALAYSLKAEMIVHDVSGIVTRHQRAALTYPTLLD